jgi:hypothetical protein
MWYIGNGATKISLPSLKLPEIHALVCLHVGQNVAVGEHCTLGDAGRAAGVLQEGDVSPAAVSTG